MYICCLNKSHMRGWWRMASMRHWRRMAHRFFSGSEAPINKKKTLVVWYYKRRRRAMWGSAIICGCKIWAPRRESTAGYMMNSTPHHRLSYCERHTTPPPARLLRETPDKHPRTTCEASLSDLVCKCFFRDRHRGLYRREPAPLLEERESVNQSLRIHDVKN